MGIDDAFALVYSEDAAGLSALLTKHPELVNARDELQGRALLHDAAAANSVEIINVLLSHGADVNVRAYGLKTPLHRSALNGCVEACEVLLKAGADSGGLNR